MPGSAADAAQTPIFSAIVPTYNRAQALGRCLQALCGQDFQRDGYEVIVVDDGGSPDLDALIADLALPQTVRLARVDHAGPAGARNHGARLARGRYLAFTDDDCRPAPDWLANLNTAFQQAPQALIGGSKVNGLPGNRYAAASQLIEDLVYAHYNSDPDRARFLASNNLALAASAFAAIGGFDESFRIPAAEDRELCDRWRHAGRPMVYAPDAVVRHYHPLTLLSFNRQHFTYGRGAAIFHRLCKRRKSGTMWREMRFHGGLPRLLRWRASDGNLGRVLTALPLLAFWQIANLAGFLYEKLATSGYRARGHGRQKL